MWDDAALAFGGMEGERGEEKGAGGVLIRVFTYIGLGGISKKS